MLSLRASAWAIAAGLVALMGCGRSELASDPASTAKPAPTGAPPEVMPRTLQLPGHVQSLAASTRQCRSQAWSESALAGFEEGQSRSSGARIVDLSATPSASSPDLIRQPASAGELVLAPATSDAVAPPFATLAQDTRRSEFVPVEMPPEVAPATEDRLPELPPALASTQSMRRHPVLNPEPLPVQMAVNSPPPAIGGNFNPDAAREHVPAPAPSARNPAAMQPVAQRAAEISNHAFSMGQRGMLYAARAELIQSLQLVAQALDVQQGTSAHTAALAAGLTALEEAEDFASPPGHLGASNDVAEITKGHQTPVLKGAAFVSPVVAQQQYFAYAQAQLAAAVEAEPVASQALYRLGKLQMAMGHDKAGTRGQSGPQAMVYYQAAMATDARNYLAANELGVLMARFGQLQDARRLLVHSISIQPHVEGWHNLAVVHQRLGETDLARRAENERQLLAQRLPPSGADTRVAWVDAQTFASAGGAEAAGPTSVPGRSATPPREGTTQTARASGIHGSASFGVRR